MLGRYVVLFAALLSVPQLVLAQCKLPPIGLSDQQYVVDYDNNNIDDTMHFYTATGELWVFMTDPNRDSGYCAYQLSTNVNDWGFAVGQFDEHIGDDVVVFRWNDERTIWQQTKLFNLGDGLGERVIYIPDWMVPVGPDFVYHDDQKGARIKIRDNSSGTQKYIVRAWYSDNDYWFDEHSAEPFYRMNGLTCGNTNICTIAMPPFAHSGWGNIEICVYQDNIGVTEHCWASRIFVRRPPPPVPEPPPRPRSLGVIP